MSDPQKNCFCRSSGFCFSKRREKIWCTADGYKHVFKNFDRSSAGKESPCISGDPSSIPGSGRSPGERIGYPLQYSWASLVAQLVKNLPAMRETRVRSLGWQNPLEKGKDTHLFWPGEFHGEYSSGVAELDTTERVSLSTYMTGPNT